MKKKEQYKKLIEKIIDKKISALKHDSVDSIGELLKIVNFYIKLNEIDCKNVKNLEFCDENDRKIIDIFISDFTKNAD